MERGVSEGREAMVSCLEPISKRLKNQKLGILLTINFLIQKGDLAQWKDVIQATVS